MTQKEVHMTCFHVQYINMFGHTLHVYWDLKCIILHHAKNCTWSYKYWIQLNQWGQVFPWIEVNSSEIYIIQGRFKVKKVLLSKTYRVECITHKFYHIIPNHTRPLDAALLFGSKQSLSSNRSSPQEWPVQVQGFHRMELFWRCHDRHWHCWAQMMLKHRISKWSAATLALTPKYNTQ